MTVLVFAQDICSTFIYVIRDTVLLLSIFLICMKSHLHVLKPYISMMRNIYLILPADFGFYFGVVVHLLDLKNK